MWVEAVGTYGSYNAANPTAPYKLNGLDLTEAEAVKILASRKTIFSSGSYSNYPGRTTIPEYGDIGMIYPSLYSMYAYSPNLEVLKISCSSSLYSSSYRFAFTNCINLREIKDNLDLSGMAAASFEKMFENCKKLESVNLKSLQCNINLGSSPLLSKTSLTYCVTNAKNTAPITITVHPDVYAKLTDTANTDWHKVLTDAAAKQITFATV